MEFRKNQLQLLVECATEPTVIYLMENEASEPVPFLFSSDAPAFSGLTEKEYLEFYRSDAAKVILPQDLPIVEDTLSRVFRDNVTGTCTYRTFHKTRGAIWTQASFRWIGEYEGKHVLIGSFSDVSSQVAENTPGGFFIYAAEEDDQFFFIGENMLRILGYTRAEFQKKFRNRFRYMVYEPDRERTLRAIADQITENGQYDMVDYRIEKKDGSLLWVHDEGHYAVDRNGRAWFYVTINDITGPITEQQRLRRKNLELSSIINSIPVGLSVYRIVSGEPFLIAANDAACRIFHFSQEEINGGTQKMFMDCVHPDDLADLTVTMRETRKPGRHKSRPFRYLGKDRRWKWLSIDVKTVNTDDGSQLLYNVLNDITAERHAEEKLERARKKQQKQFRTSLQALLFANPQSLCTVRLNLSRNRCMEWYGTSQFVIRTIKADTAEGVIENISRIIINEEERQKFREHFDRTALLSAFRNGRMQDIVRYRRSIEDGTSIWVETIVNMVENPDTHEIEAVLFSEDVNDQVMNEQIIQKSNDAGYDYIATLRVRDGMLFFRYFGSAVQKKRPDIFCNIEKTYRYSDITRYALDTWVADDEKEHFAKEAAIGGIVSRLNRTGSYMFTVKSRTAAGPDGAEGWKQIRITWLDDSKDWILFQQTDISDAILRQQKELIERLNVEKTLRNEADKANESKSDFLSSVSHDMRTPLNAILGYDRLALESDRPEEKEAYLEKIGKAGRTLLSLINETLDLQKIENGVTTLRPEPVGCGTVVEGILTAVKPLMEAKHIHFVFDNSKAVMSTVDIDAMRVEEIFINLLSNAAKFTPEGGHVLFSVECVKETEEEIQDKLIVKDDGHGISKKFLSRIYEPFTQERSKQTAGIGGSGLGLSIVKRLVDLMHGRIEVKSRLGVGTEFTVYLTLKKSDMKKNAGKRRKAANTVSLRGRKVLLCEDNEMNREIARAILEKKEIHVDSAINGKEGVRMFRHSAEGEYAAVLMDIRMPVMDGYEAAKEIRKCDHADAERIPIIALTADAYAGDVRKTRECGMNGHLSKPIDPDMLFQVLQEAVAAGDRK